jgi:predicted regulator of amino acid metabolism with ACT domain
MTKLKSILIVLCIIIIFYYCSFFNDENPYSGITETVIDSLDEYGIPIWKIISEDPDDWNINYNQK